MAINIVIPPLGESISEATIATINKKNGESVKMDELLIELETDKVTLELNSPAGGIISSLTVQKGDNVIVGQIIGTISEGGTGDILPVSTEKPQMEKEVPSVSSSSPAQGNFSPAVRRIIEEQNLKTNNIEATGKDGRITKGDALSALNTPKTSIQVNSSKEEKVGSSISHQATDRNEMPIKMSKIRQVIARRLKESQNTAAILTTFNEVDMSSIMSIRSEFQDVFIKKYGMKLGFMSFFMKACIIALKEIPAVNAEIRGDEVIYKNYCDIGVAVGTEEGLVVPVVRNADKMGFAQLEKSVYEFGQKAKQGKISLEELKGGTFTISNGGTYGSLLSTPIINPPQSGILGMHKIQERPVAIKGQVVVRPMMYTALSYDHRIIDGKEAVTFLVRIKELLEDPRRLVLDI